ncbi:hypothetical protein [Legionella sp. WA2022007384]
MFNKKEEEQTDATQKGSFSGVPDDVMFQIMFFLDLKSLNYLYNTNKTFRSLVSRYPKQIYIKICDEDYNGTFPKIRTQFIGFLERRHTEILRQKRSEAEKEIVELKKSIKAQKDEISQIWDLPLKKSCITKGEKAAVGCGCSIGLAVGIVVSCFTPLPWIFTTCLGMGVGGSTPLVVSRTIRCCCGKCVECNEQELATKQENFHKDYPDSPSMKM